MQSTDLVILVLGIVLYALVSRKGESGSLTGPMVFTLFGLLVGGDGLELVAFPIENSALHTLAEITLVVALFTDAARIDVTRLSAQHDVPLRLLAIGLPLTMLLGTVVAWGVFPGLGLWSAAVLGVILAPTDAALGQAVLANRTVPERIRQALNVESGLNDGLAFPILLIVLSLAFETGESRGAGGWTLFVVGQIVLGPLVGWAVGRLGSRAVEICAGRNWMNHVFLQIAVLGLALLAYGAAESVAGNGFIAAFAAGAAIAGRSRRVLDAVEDFGETEGQLLSLVVFLLFGAVLLPAGLAALDWRHVVYAFLSLTVIRMVPVAICLAGTRLRPASVAFLGWFGPRGLASILYLLLIVEAAELAPDSDIAATVLVTVLLSVLLHGASAVPFAARYTRHMAQARGEAEHRPVSSFPTRLRHPRAPAEDTGP